MNGFLHDDLEWSISLSQLYDLVGENDPEVPVDREWQLLRLALEFVEHRLVEFEVTFQTGREPMTLFLERCVVVVVVYGGALRVCEEETTVKLHVVK